MYYRWNETVHFLFRDGQYATYLFESLLFKESILSEQIRESEAIIKLLNFLA
jgi:hypothetical protein